MSADLGWKLCRWVLSLCHQI